MPERFSSIFEIALVLLGVFSATEFQYFWQMWGPIIALRLSTSPFFLIIPIWLIKELLKRQMSLTFWLLLSEFCWFAWSVTLSYYLLFWWSFQIQQLPLISVIAPTSLAVMMMGVVWYAYYRQYKTVVNYYKSIRWVFIKVVLLIVVVIAISLMFVTLPAPTTQN